jgi:hypothetical protein
MKLEALKPAADKCDIIFDYIHQSLLHERCETASEDEYVPVHRVVRAGL